MSRTSLFLVVALVIAAARAAHAGPAWRVDAGNSTRWLGSTSAASLTTETLATANFGAERTVAVVHAPFGIPVELAGGVGVSFGSVTGTVFQTLATEIDAADFVAAAHATAHVSSRIAISGRASLGAARAAVTVTDMYSLGLTPVDDHGWGSVSAASLGAEFAPVATRRFRLGVGAEVGYVATSAIAMHAYPGDRPDGDLAIATTYASIGHLDLGGWALRFSVHAAF